MRSLLNNSLEALIWTATIIFILTACYSGAMTIRLAGANQNDFFVVMQGFLEIIVGVTMSFVFAGLSFQLMDIRKFTKHAAMSLRRGS